MDTNCLLRIDKNWHVREWHGRSTFYSDPLRQENVIETNDVDPYVQAER